MIFYYFSADFSLNIIFSFAIPFRQLTHCHFSGRCQNQDRKKKLNSFLCTNNIRGNKREIYTSQYHRVMYLTSVYVVNTNVLRLIDYCNMVFFFCCNWCSLVSTNSDRTTNCRSQNINIFFPALHKNTNRSIFFYIILLPMPTMVRYI